MPKKKSGATNGAEAHPALLSDEGPERKTRDDLIVDDPQTQMLLRALLGKWSNVPQLEEYYTRKLDDALHLAEVRLRARYMIGDYYAGTGEKPAMTFSEIYEASRRRRESAAGRLEAIIGDRVKARLLEALEEAVRLAAEAEADAIERRIKAAVAKRKAKFTRHVKEAFTKPMTGEEYHFGRPTMTARDEVERRSVEIIRAINAGPGDKGRVAMAYYGNYDLSQAFERYKLERDYRTARDKGETDKALDKYRKLLARQKPIPLEYERLLEVAAGDWYGKTLYEYLATPGVVATEMADEAPQPDLPDLADILSRKYRAAPLDEETHSDLPDKSQ